MRTINSHFISAVKRVIIFFCIILFIQCDILCPPDNEWEPNNNLEQALAWIQDFKQTIAEEAGANSVAAKSWQYVEVGQVWTHCKNDNSLFGPHSVQTYSFLGHYNIDTRSVQDHILTFDWARNWKRDESLGLKILDVAIEAAVENSNVAGLEIEISVKNAILKELTQPVSYYNEYISIVNSSSERIPGNILVTGVVLAEVRMGIKAFNKNKKRLELGLGVKINDLPEVNGNYVSEEGTEQNFEYIQENGENSATTFAAIFLNISDDLIDHNFINEQTNGSPCYLAANDPKPIRILLGIDQTSGEPIYELEFEESIVNDVRKWALFVRNISNETISSHSISIRAENKYGQFIDTETILVLTMSPGQISDKGELLRFRDKIPLNEARIRITVN